MNREKFRKIHDLLMGQLDVSRELSDEEILEVIDDLILNQVREEFFSLKEKVDLRQELFCSVRKLDVLQELIEDERVTEIMVNGPDAIFVERAGKLARWDKVFTSREKLEDVIQQIVGRCNRVVNESSPIVDARLENGARVNAVVYPVALNGPILTIRRFPDDPITMEKLISLGSITRECADFLKKLVQARYSMVIGGGTGSGKTTLIKLINGLLAPKKGELFINGNTPGVESKKIVSYLPERTYLDETQKVSEAITLFEDFYEDFDKNRATSMLEKLNIDSNARIKTLSKGTKEKVQLILVMSRRAKLYCLDEPIAGVDPAARDYILSTIINNYEPDSTILISTHLISDVENILDEVVFIKNGHIVLKNDVEDIRFNQGKSVDVLFREVFKC